MKNILSKRELKVIEWMADCTFEDVIEGCENGISGGLHRIHYDSNNGIFDKKYIKDLLKTNQGDNDFDYELGNGGWSLVLDNIDQIAKEYLKFLSDFKVLSRYGYAPDNEVVLNIKNSLEKIIKG